MISSRTNTEIRRPPTRPRWLLLALIVASLIRFIYGYQFWNSPLAELYRADHQFYREWARQIASGQWSPGHIFEQGPLYAYLAGIFYSLFGVNDVWLFSLQSASGVAIVWLTYRVGQIAFNEWTARIAALLVGCYGPLVFFEFLTMKTFLTPLGCVLLAYCLLQIEPATSLTRRNVLWITLSALVVGGLCLIRENYLLLLPVVIWAAGAGLSLWKRTQVATIPIIIVLLTTLPATLHNTLLYGEKVWVTSGGGEVLYMAWAPDATGYYRAPDFVRPTPIFEHEDFRLEASRRLGHPVNYQESSRYWGRVAFFEVMTSPFRAGRLAIQKLLIALNDFEVPDSEYFDVTRKQIPFLNLLPTFGWVCGWGILGISLAGLRDQKRLTLLLILLIHLLSIILTYNFSRFRIGMLPLWILFASFAIVTLVQGITSTNRSRVRWSLAGVIAGSLICLCSFLPPPQFAQSNYVPMADQFLQFLEQRKRNLDLAREMESRRSSLSPEEQFKLAVIYFEAKKNDKAEQLLQQIIQQQPDRTDARELLAILQGDRGDYTAAEETLRAALKLNPENTDLWANLGTVYYHRALRGTLSFENRKELLLEAERAYTQGLKTSPEDTTCRSGIAGIQRSLEQLAD